MIREMPIIHRNQHSRNSFVVERFSAFLGKHGLSNVADLNKVFNKCNQLVVDCLPACFNETPENNDMALFAGKMRLVDPEEAHPRASEVNCLEVRNRAISIVTINNARTVTWKTDK
jgi:hypothetical protein